MNFLVLVEEGAQVPNHLLLPLEFSLSSAEVIKSFGGGSDYIQEPHWLQDRD